MHNTVIEVSTLIVMEMEQAMVSYLLVLVLHDD